ncbi:ABC transporter family substrate-binding protein [Pseudonocardia acaciae]|uniref:ABC transporter family substrate-binding protein n=1 Tax=Pseudonocardia acaciae TaxID=551276 RepID=UPI00048AAE57|nr:ABC transporter family substrate-binding protein [Pseudonocardia acaciae]
MTRTLLACAVAGALLLTSCGGGSGARLEAPPPPGAQDLNPRDPATLRDGGDLRLPLDNLPVNYNYNSTDGHEGQTHQVLWALMPRAFDEAADGGTALNTDLLASADLVSTSPQVVRYRINERAVWSTGRPITWEDFAAQVRANNGSNTEYQFSDKTGYVDIEKVERGGGDKEAVVTFRKPFAEWQGRLFNGLYPKEMNDDPKEFNGWLTEPKITAGPFRVDRVDLTAKTITLVRNERWWGARPRLDRIIFTVTERSALADRLANNEIDAYEIGSSTDLFERARKIPSVQIRRAIPKQYSHLTFNGAPGRVLADKALRRAVAKGIDRAAIAQRLVGRIVGQVTPMGNHIFPIGSKGYRDNSASAAFDPVAANRELDALGWVRPAGSAVRARDGQPLRLHFVTPSGNPISEQTAKTVLDQLAQIGVEVVIDPAPTAQFFSDFVNVGNFDLTTFQWITTGSPFSDSAAIYQDPTGTDVGGNFGRIYDPTISAKFAQGITELDDAKRIELGNEIDRLIWDEVHHLPLYPQTGAYAVRENVANYGAKGLADPDYTKVGFTP